MGAPSAGRSDDESLALVTGKGGPDGFRLALLWKSREPPLRPEDGRVRVAADAIRPTLQAEVIQFAVRKPKQRVA